MVMATPLLHALRASLDGELWGIGKSSAVDIYNGLEIFDRFIPLDSAGPLSFLDAVGLLRTLNFRRGIVLPHSFRSALLFFTAGIKERVGYARNGRGFILTHRIAEGAGPEPTVEHYLRVIDELGGRRMLDAPLLLVTEAEEQKFDKKYPDLCEPFIAFIAGARYGPSKCWPDRYFSELADLIVRDHDIKICILPGKDEEELARRIYEKVTNKERVRVVSMGMRELKVCLSRALLVVSNDTGPRHISVALSTPTIVFIGPMDERYTYYPSACTHPLSADVTCRPCNRKRCDKDHQCMTEIEPKDVFAKLEEMLADRAKRAG
jgi:heptosyltransferase II